MSTVKAVNFQHPSATQNNLVLAADGTVSGGLPSANRNLLYNGAMQVAQRGTSTAGIAAAGYYTADRWNLFYNALGTHTMSIENDAPTGSGFRKSLKLLVTTAKASPAASDWLFFEQALEGQDLQRIAKGTASAQQLTVSFWVKSNRTGTFCVTLTDADNSREVSAQYTVSASATWERKTITFPADTTGAFDNDNAASLALRFGLAVGSDRSSGTLPSTWQASVTANLFVGQTNLAAATNNYWQVTGVQLEVGPVASAFEFKPFGQELRECQRYYEKSYAQGAVPGTNTNDGLESSGTSSNNSNNAMKTIRFKVEKRAAGSVAAYLNSGTVNTWSYGRSGASGTLTPTIDLIETSSFRIYGNVGSAWVSCTFEGHWVASAEL